MRQARRALVGIGLAGLLCVSGGVAQAAWPGQFKDVDTWPKWGLFGERYDEETFAAWGGDLAEAVWWELMVGDPPASGISTELRMFRPYDAITRAEFATVLGRALGFEKRGIGAEWFRPIVDQLMRDGIISKGGNFNTPITRREMGEWVGRALEWYGVELERKPELDLKDIQGLPEAQYIRLATRAGVIKGYPDGTYRPNQTATRAEAAAMGVRFAKQLRKNLPDPGVFEQHFRDLAKAAAEGVKEALEKGTPFDHAYLLEPYLSEMVLYGYGGYDISTYFVMDYYDRKYLGYSELVSIQSEPIFVRDTIALVKNSVVVRGVQIDGTDLGTDSDTYYCYYVKRNGRWFGTNTKWPQDYPEGWKPVPEVANP
ncbi:MAG TPA: S-layer homology domain-containing protein [Symbiobacteriaceae bacterium]